MLPDSTTLSIITPFKNAEHFVHPFIQSLKRQTYTNWVCILIDDGSTDDGARLLADLIRDDPRFLLTSNQLRKTSPGPAAARNWGLTFVKTPILCFCDIDDLWHPSKLAQQLKFHTDNGLDLSVTAYAKFRGFSTDTPPFANVCPPISLPLPCIPPFNPIPMLTAMVSTDCVKNSFQQVNHEDYLFWLHLIGASTSLKYGCLPNVLAFYRTHSGALTSKKVKMPLWTFAVYRQFGLSRHHSLVKLFQWSIRHLSIIMCSLIKSPCSSRFSVSMMMDMPPLHLSPSEKS